MDKVWIDPIACDVPADLAAWVGGHPVIAETLFRRGIVSVDQARAFLDPDFYIPAPATDFPDIVRAAERLELAIRNHERILVWGDFDVDGQTSTTVLVTVLQDLGADVRFHIPVRGIESHGMKFPRFIEVLEEGTDLILTCDTGVSEHEAVDYANARNITTIITDHHELPDQLPQAYAVINPHLLPAGHPLLALPGVGVAYKLAELLYDRAGRSEETQALLDLVALGIVADVAEQTGDTRYLLQRGLAVLRQTPRLGLREMAGLAQFKLEAIHEETIGFAIGPRLNALGRLSDANGIVEFFTTRDRLRARNLAADLEALNIKRRLLCQQIEDAANAHIDMHPEILDDAALVLAGSQWQPGVIGIVASRLVEKYNRPVVLLSAPPGGIAHGSARSVNGCHITEAIATQSDLLEAYGGHSAAAGLSLSTATIDRFRRGFTAAVSEQLLDADRRTVFYIDGYLKLAELNIKLAEDFERLAPFGAGNPSLRFAVRGVQTAGSRALGGDGRHLLLRVQDDEGVSKDVHWWRWDGVDLPEAKFDLAFTLRKDTYRGQTRVQIVLEDIREHMLEPSSIKPLTSKSIDLLDMRYESNDAIKNEIDALGCFDSMFIYCEGNHKCLYPCSTRIDAEPSDTLVLWTTPPSPVVLGSLMQIVKPKRVVVVCRGDVSYMSLIAQILGGIKYALEKKSGLLDVNALAAKLGYTGVIVRQALNLLVAKGSILAQQVSEDVYRISLQRSEPDEDLANAIQQNVWEIFSELQAFVKHFQTVKSEKLRQYFSTRKPVN